MKSRILNKAVSILMIGIALAGTLISCDGTANAIPQDMEEVEVKASVIDETKSLEAYFGETVANDVTHYRWVMTHKNPTRVYDTGYVPRATAEAHQMFANMNGTHKILTGEYDWTFSGYVYDGAGSGDANYHKVAEVSNTGEIINARTQSVAIELNTLVGQNQGAEITAKLPVDFYREFQSDPNALVFTVTAEKVGSASAGEFSVTPDSIADAGTNAVLITLPSFDTGSYNIRIQIDLMKDSAMVDRKTEVAVLRSITGSIAKGDMNFASTSLTINALNVTLVDKTGDIINANADMDSFTLTGLNFDQAPTYEDYTNESSAVVTLSYTETEGMDLEVVWYIDGIEATTEQIEVQAADPKKYDIKRGAIYEGTHILAAVLVDRNMNMSAGSVTFEVTVAESAPSSGGSSVKESDIKAKAFSGTVSNTATIIYFDETGYSQAFYDHTPTAERTTQSGQINPLIPWSFTEQGFMFGGSPASATYDSSTGLLSIEGMGDLTKIETTGVPDNEYAAIAASGFNIDGAPSVTTDQVKGYWEQCNSNGSEISGVRKWLWISGDPSTVYDNNSLNAGFGSVENGTSQSATVVSRWNLHSGKNLLSFINTHSISGGGEQLRYSFRTSVSGDILTIQVFDSSIYSDYTDSAYLKVGETYYFKSASMGSSVRDAITGEGGTI